MTDAHLKTIVAVSWPHNERADGIGMAPEILSFNDETRFRAYVNQIVLEDPDQCVRFARSWRQAQAAFPLPVKDTYYLKDPRRVRVADIGIDGLHLVTDLAPDATLNWEEYQERWKTWYLELPEVTMCLPDALLGYFNWEDVPDIIEELVDPLTPLENIIDFLETHGDYNEENPRDFEVFISERPQCVTLPSLL
jgi:hypothetical protein